MTGPRPQTKRNFSAWMTFILLFVSILLNGSSATAQPRARSLDSTNVTDLSLSLLRDNYDIWAGELMNSLLVENTRELAEIQMGIDAVRSSERLLAEQVRDRIVELYKAKLTDETSVRSAIWLAADSQSIKEKIAYLKDAGRMADDLSPGSVQAYRVGVVYLAHLLKHKDLAEAVRTSRRIVSMASREKLRSQPETCIGYVLAGDSYFESGEYDESGGLYDKAQSCVAQNKTSEKILSNLSLSLRLVWSAFRRMKYQQALANLENLLTAQNAQKLDSNAKIKKDLSLILSVSLSELSMAVPPSVWLDATVRFDWVADGLVKTVSYLMSKDDTATLRRWVEALESPVSNHPVALEFFRLGEQALDKVGALDARLDFMARAALALHPGGPLARRIALDPATDQRRRLLAAELVRAVTEQRAQQAPDSLTRSSVNTVFRVAELVFEDNPDVCAQVDALRNAHKVLAGTLQMSTAEKIFSWFQQCQAEKRHARETLLRRIEMFRGLVKRSSDDTESWKKYVQLGFEALEQFSTDAEVRRVTLELLHDSLERNSFLEGEKIFLLHALSLDVGSESAHWEIEGLVGSAARLLSQRSVGVSLEAAGWSLLKAISVVFSSADERRRTLEASLAYTAYRSSLAARQQGNILASVDTLSASAFKFAQDSVYRRDMLFQAARRACVSMIESECVSLSGQYVAEQSHPPGDLFVMRALRGEALIRSGQFTAAADNWMDSFQNALDSKRPEFIDLAKQNIMKAGDIYAELKLWKDVLLAKSSLTKISSLSGNAQGTHSALFRWTIDAVDAKVWEVSVSLAADLEIWFKAMRESQVGARSQVGSMQLLSRLVESFTNARIAGARASGYQDSLLALLNLKTQSKPDALFTSRRMDTQVKNFIVFASEQWKEDLLSEAETLSRVTKSAEMVSAVTKISQSFDNLRKGCDAVDKFTNSTAFHDFRCLSDVKSRFGNIFERLSAAVMRLNVEEKDSVSAVEPLLIGLNSKINASRPSNSNAKVHGFRLEHLIEHRNEFGDVNASLEASRRGAR